MTEFDEVPIQFASTLVLIDDRPDLHVFMMRRNARSVFVGDMWMFPGGGLDPQDSQANIADRCRGLTDEAATRRLEIETAGLAWWIAALRETYEEAGVLLASHATAAAIDAATAERLEEHRVRVEAAHHSFADVLREEGLQLELADMHYIARWITPQPSPRRYDTRFFLAAMPPGQTARHDNREAVHSEWIRPADALEEWARGEMSMLPPTRGVLQLLATYEHSADTLADAAAQQDDRDRPIKRLGSELDDRLVLPGDDDYEHPDAVPLVAWARVVANPPTLP